MQQSVFVQISFLSSSSPSVPRFHGYRHLANDNVLPFQSQQGGGPYFKAKFEGGTGIMDSESWAVSWPPQLLFFFNKAAARGTDHRGRRDDLKILRWVSVGSDAYHSGGGLFVFNPTPPTPTHASIWQRIPSSQDHSQTSTMLAGNPFDPRPEELLNGSKNTIV